MFASPNTKDMVEHLMRVLDLQKPPINYLCRQGVETVVTSKMTLKDCFSICSESFL
jgi:hypothetical protein